MVRQIPGLKLLYFWNASKRTVRPFHDPGMVCMVTCDHSGLLIFDNGYMPRVPEYVVVFDRCLSWASQMRLHSDG
jgi:hypothetical protein